MFTRIAVIGCGLIGGSFALALKAAGLVGEVVAFDRDAEVAERARALGIADRVATSIVDAATAADLVVVAAPVAQIEPVFSMLASVLPSTAIVMDVGSTKADLVAAARRALGAALARYVPAHPIAGGEVHGPDAARADLFRDRRVLLTPLPETDADALDRITRAWQACGADVRLIDATDHDRVLSAVSHLPHLLAYALVAQIAEADDAALKFALAGAGFRDFTRIAASSPEMWRDIAIANRDALLADLDAFRARLDRLRADLDASDRDALTAMFTRASVARAAWRPALPPAAKD